MNHVRSGRLVRVVVAIAVASALTTFAETNAPSTASSNHVVMITLDGMRPEFYLPGELSVSNKTLTDLRDTGSYAKRVFPPYPSFTYPGHTAMVTEESAYTPARSRGGFFG